MNKIYQKIVVIFKIKNNIIKYSKFLVMLHLKNDNNKNFEKYIFENIFEKIKYEYTPERNVKYNDEYSSVKYVIELEDICLCIENNNDISIRKIINFVEAVKNISKNTGKKCIALYLSLKKISERGNEAFTYENEHTNNEFIVLYDDNREIICKNLIDILYTYKIYMYENDDSCIMLE
jgi:hypothetical protein